MRLRGDALGRDAIDQAPAQRIAVQQEALEPTGPLAARPPAAGEAPRGLEGDVAQDRLRHELVHDAKPERLGRALHFARKDDVEGRARADQPRQALAAARAGQDAELDFREADLGLGMVAGNAIGARQRELEAAAQAPAVNAHRDGFAEIRNAIDQLLPFGREPLRLGGVGEGDELLDVGAGDEIVGLARKQGHGFDTRVPGEPFERRAKLRLHGGGDGVDRFAGDVERDDGDAVGHLPGERGHQRRSSTSANAMPPCAQIETRPNCTSRRRISFASVVMTRPPVAPNG